MTSGSFLVPDSVMCILTKISLSLRLVEWVYDF